MRKATRAIVLAFLGFLSAVVVGVAAVMTAAITLAATALIVPGTGTHNIVPPNAVTGYMENARARFIAPADSDCPNTNSCVLQGVPYPASFWPIPIPGWCPGLSCDTWNVSVGTGVKKLDAQVFKLLFGPRRRPERENHPVRLFAGRPGRHQRDVPTCQGISRQARPVRSGHDRQHREPARAVGTVQFPAGPNNPNSQCHIRASTADEHRDQEHQLCLRVRPRRRRTPELVEPAGHP